METKFKVGDKIVVCNNCHHKDTITYKRDCQIGYIKDLKIGHDTILIDFEDNGNWLNSTVYKDSIQHYIETKEQNMKTVVLPIEIARKMYLHSKDESVREFALSNYSKEELEAKELPKSWEELKEVKGCTIDINSDMYVCNNKTVYKTLSANRNIFPTKSLAEAALALSQLLQLREVYRNGWIPDYTKDDIKYCIMFNKNNLNLYQTVYYSRLFSFQSKEIAQQFLSNFEELLETCKELI